jgi:large subunit ribosomal protein L8e
MGKTIRAQRFGKSAVYKAHTTKRIAPAKLRNLDYVERNGYIRGVVRDIVHDSGRGAALAKIEFKDPTKYQRNTEYFVAPEGLYTGQYIYCGAKAALSVGNVLPLGVLPEGTIVCNVEGAVNDKGQFAKSSGTAATVIGHSEDGSKTRVKLPSGARKTVSSNCRAMIGIVSGGGRTDKPVMKAGILIHKFRAKRKKYPEVKALTMNPVDHRFGGGNHQHIGRPATISRYAPPGRKVGLIAARRTGLLRGGKGEKKVEEVVGQKK